MIDDIKKYIDDEKFEIDLMMPTTGDKTKLQVITVFAIENILDKHKECEYKANCEHCNWFKNMTAPLPTIQINGGQDEELQECKINYCPICGCKLVGIDE